MTSKSAGSKDTPVLGDSQSDLLALSEGLSDDAMSFLVGLGKPTKGSEVRNVPTPARGGSYRKEEQETEAR